ncbi:MAG: hypothetical protein UT76_C0042G0002 [Candidatus Woesebacteria bacterium GW2011_GWB1_40_12]|uniref:CxxC-x17-CxxC domain-containing protein n=5 Tax=Candidatus Woeseibacteriota TaxID=1752722 RepID=A0A0G0TRQ0_9BACT|nr:MAG: hypothetical protein UT76_C0042G0002 [Candidatus Woesebacteria bacterium GW2011_GWB1_40_12]
MINTMGNFNRDDNRSGGYRGGFGRGGGGGGFSGKGRREMFQTVCSNCGKECQVPFRPTNGKPVYCSECFEKMNGGRSDSRRSERSDFRSPAPGFDQNKAQLDAVNAKLDKILSILTQAPVIKDDSGDVKEVKPEKVKKVAKKTASTKKK